MPTRIGIISSIVFLAALATTSVALAQDGPPAAVEQEASAGEKRAAFDALFVEWKDMLKRLRALGLEYQTADADRKAEIRVQYAELVKQGEVMQDPLVDAAEEAFVESPNPKGDLAEFLVGVATWESSTDNYERGLALSKTLIDNNCRDKYVLAVATLAAFATCELDTAEAYAQMTQEAGGLDALTEMFPEKHFCARPLKGFTDQIPYYREAWAKEQAIRKAEATADDLPRVLLTTDAGEIELELYENEAPNTVANFISLVEAGFYDGLTFHRVLPGFMAQGGCPNGDGTGDAGYKIPCECSQPNHRLHFRGVVSMAKSVAPNTGSCQFFINFQPTLHLDGAHTVFGRIVRGMGVASDLQRTDPDEKNQPDSDRILTAKVLRKRDHEYAFKKAGE